MVSEGTIHGRLIYGTAEPGYRTISMANGHTKAVVTCPDCNHLNYFAMWSWAGNGWCKCKGCGVRLRYATGQTVRFNTVVTGSPVARSDDTTPQ